MTRKYNVYGIGNALVDIVTEVEDQFLRENNIEKGLMTLIEKEHQTALYRAIESRDSNMQCGGSAANTMIAISQFGGNSYYSCKVSDDVLGHFYMNDMKKNGVDSNLQVATLPKGITGKCLVMTTPDATRTMNTFLGITAQYSRDEIDKEIIEQAEYLYVEGYLVTSDNGLDAMKYAKELAEKCEVKVALTFSDPSMVKYFKEQMQEVVGAGVDLLFCNEEEAMLFTDTDNIAGAREALKKYAAKFAITQGANGAMIFDGNTFINIAPYLVEAIDTNGAGDLFAGAFLYGITNGCSFEEAARLASFAASKVVTKYGPRLDLAQVRQVMTNFV